MKYGGRRPFELRSVRVIVDRSFVRIDTALPSRHWHTSVYDERVVACDFDINGYGNNLCEVCNKTVNSDRFH